jgi:DNA-binding NtrC family response regulator
LKNKIGKVLIVDDDPDVLQAASLLLKKHVELLHTEKDPSCIPALLKNESYDVIFLDMNFSGDLTSGKEGFHWLDKIVEIDPSVVVILITAYGDIETAVRAIKEGATDFILKPWQNEKLLATLFSALQLRESRKEASQLKVQQKQLSADIDQRYQNIIGESPAMERIYNQIEKVAGTDANVLILGENGTGKELIARAIHRQSQRADKVFLSVDMGAISDTLFESELFGHVKGAFTDAKEDRPGRFEVASGGTLFLDEIGNLPLPLQSKILNVLENRIITRLGANKTIPIDIRLICATNMPLYNMVKENKFRQDLLYRINTLEIELPPLRERKEDIPVLSEHFMQVFAKKYKRPARQISAGAVNKLQKYHWPGNIRELRHVVERTVIMSESTVLQPGEFLFSASDDKTDKIVFEDYKLETVEKILIQKMLKKHSGNVSKAAKELGLTRTSLYRRMEKYDM